ncbi:MAG: hypothetical protein WCI22_06100 [Actinomycetota bacterium]
MKDLLTLLEAAGHDGFRDARGPMGFTQRQAAGKFTRDEAQAFIDQLESEAGDAMPQPAPTAPTAPTATTAPTAPTATTVVRLTANERAVRAVTDAELLAEVKRRGLSLG